MKLDPILENYSVSGKHLDIVTYPDPVLTKVAKEVSREEFGEELSEFCKDMLYTMYFAPGIGLAAPQVGVSKRIFVIDVNYEREHNEESHEPIIKEIQPRIFINPKIKVKNGETAIQEGCLSLPGVYEEVKRAEKITVEYQNTSGEVLEMEADELLSICIQHENDHLDGVVFIDRLSLFKKNFFRKKLIKEKKKKSLKL